MAGRKSVKRGGKKRSMRKRSMRKRSEKNTHKRYIKKGGVGRLAPDRYKLWGEKVGNEEEERVYSNSPGSRKRRSNSAMRVNSPIKSMSPKIMSRVDENSTKDELINQLKEIIKIAHKNDNDMLAFNAGNYINDLNKDRYKNTDYEYRMLINFINGTLRNEV